MKFYGSITLVPGDNLASQFIGGYKSLASAHRKCRHCMAVASDMKTKVSQFIVYTFTLTIIFSLVLMNFNFVIESLMIIILEHYQ